MQRHTTGIAAIALLAVGVWTYGESDSALSGVCLRVGAVLAFLWLALPQLQRVPTWLVGVLAVSLLLIMRWPRLLLAAAPIAFVLWLLRPRSNRRGNGIADPRE